MHSKPLINGGAQAAVLIALGSALLYAGCTAETSDDDEVMEEVNGSDSAKDASATESVTSSDGAQSEENDGETTEPRNDDTASGPTASDEADSDKETMEPRNDDTASDVSSSETINNATSELPESETINSVDSDETVTESNATEEETDSIVEPEPLPTDCPEQPLIGAGDEAQLNEFGTLDCKDHRLICASGCAYRCENPRNFDFEDIPPRWLNAPEVTCPLWSYEQCLETLETLRQSSKPCSNDLDCELWAPAGQEFECREIFLGPILSVSTLLSPSESEALRASFDAAVLGGCQTELELDPTPELPVCEDGQCALTEGVRCGSP